MDKHQLNDGTMLSFLEIQKKLQFEFLKLDNGSSFVNKTNTIDESVIKNGILLLVKECMEVLDEFNYKDHILEKKKLNMDNILIEMIDIFKFWLNIVIYLDYSSEQICNVFDKKTLINYDKIESQLKSLNEKNTNS